MPSCTYKRVRRKKPPYWCAAVLRWWYFMVSCYAPNDYTCQVFRTVKRIRFRRHMKYSHARFMKMPRLRRDWRLAMWSINCKLFGVCVDPSEYWNTVATDSSSFAKIELLPIFNFADYPFKLHGKQMSHSVRRILYIGTIWSGRITYLFFVSHF